MLMGEKDIQYVKPFEDEWGLNKHLDYDWRQLGFCHQICEVKEQLDKISGSEKTKMQVGNNIEHKD